MEASHAKAAPRHGRFDPPRADAHRGPRCALGGTSTEMKPLVKRNLWYNLRHRSQPTRWPKSASGTRHTMVIIGGNCSPACGDTPHSGPCRAILNCGLGECASHGRTDRPSPHLDDAGLARVALRPPVASLQTRALTARGPVRGAFVLPATHDGGFASATPFRGVPAPENPDKGCRALDHSPGDFRVPAPTTRACALWTTRRRLSCPCTQTRGCAPSTTRAVAL
jgi:hypothetical protein